MLGAMIGDYVGSIWEYEVKKPDYDVELFTEKNRLTDDSFLTAAVADILVNNKPVAETLKEYVGNYPSDYGNGFLLWAWSDQLTGYNSYGNGAAMRISPVGWYAKSESEVKKLSKKITEVTHNHPEGLKGAETVAMCIYKALHGATMEELHKYIVFQYPEVDFFDYDTLKQEYFFSESCQDTVPEALYCFLISDNFEDCLRKSLSIGGDSDTLCCISCAVAEAFYRNIGFHLVHKLTDYLQKHKKAELLENILKIYDLKV